MPERLSIFEVAKQANCSIATVSNVLNNKGRVSAQKRKDILKIVTAVGYRVNSAGRNLRMKRTEIFGLLFYPSCAEIFGNPFYAEVMGGLERRLTQAGYHLLLAGYEAATANSPIPDFLRTGKVDGIILMGRFPTEIIRNFSKLKTPLLLLDSNAEWPLDSVVSDGFSAGVQLVRHLAEKGHKRIVMLAYVWEDYNIDLRIQGFRAGLRELGLEENEGSVIRHAISHVDLYKALKERLDGPNPNTAVVAVNDTLAVTMIRCMQEDGLRVPEDVSVTGYDDEKIAQDMTPPLTTVRVNKPELGRAGAELILERASMPKSPVAKMRLPVDLIERQSVAAPPADR
ncbi:MAG: LacI family DNA-binding transcriptional regulator [Candidatus Methylacidiphilales bacterium]